MALIPKSRVRDLLARAYVRASDYKMTLDEAYMAADFDLNKLK